MDLEWRKRTRHGVALEHQECVTEEARHIRARTVCADLYLVGAHAWMQHLHLAEPALRSVASKDADGKAVLFGDRGDV